MVTGGSEASITEASIGGLVHESFVDQNDRSTRAQDHWRKIGNGFVMGEGAGLILEEYELQKTWSQDPMRN